MAIADYPRTLPSPVRARTAGTARIERFERSTILWLHGDLDIATLPEESLAMASAIAEELPLIVDMSGVGFLDASTIGLLASSATFVTARAGSLSVRAPSPSVRRVLVICGLDGLILRPGGSGTS